jgi:signal transduction histidine kinase
MLHGTTPVCTMCSMLAALDQPTVSRHKCLIYDGDPSEQLRVVVPLLKDGLENNWRCLYLGAPEIVEMVQSALAGDGFDIAWETRRGALVFSSDRSHLAGGTFDPAAMIAGLCALIDDAVRDGFQGLCATGDMRWELGDDRNFERLLEYEARLERVFREKPLRGICQYHRDVLPPQAIRDALVTHRSAYIGGVLNRDNLFYIPPELLLGSDDGPEGSKQGEWMCQQIIRVLDAEQKRDTALTALRESEAHQRRLAEQLAEMNRDLERRVVERTAELQAAMQQLESFSYSVSHDLRAPLRAIRGFSEALADEFGATLGTEGRQHLERVLQGVRRMDELISGMLSLARVVKGELQRVPVDLTALAEAVAGELRASDPGRSAQFVIHRDLRTVADETLLRAVLTNLIGNAWKFSSQAAPARIEVGRLLGEGGQSVFFVRDNGAGFDMNHAQQLFKVFQRLHREDEYPGTGIGLATVHRIITSHGGRIWAEARPGEGATFRFTLGSVADR